MTETMPVSPSGPTTPGQSAGPPDARVGGRTAALAAVDPVAADLVRRLVARAPSGLAAAHLAATGEFAQTVRRGGTPASPVAVEGTSVRYAAIAALGLSRLPRALQQVTLGERTAAEVVTLAARRALHDDIGALALTAWADAEVNDHYADLHFLRLRRLLRSDEPLPTVDTSWMVVAALAAAHLGDTAEVVDRGVRRLLAGQGPLGTYPHVLGHAHRGIRSHVGSFADQIYPVQALARASHRLGERAWLAAADRTADRLCELQGAAGQWWWHYDQRDGSVVERYPVYSVHQHAMAPMALLDLAEAGGRDHTASVARGVRWLAERPETTDDLVAEPLGLVWRKVGRREPRKVARGLAATTTAIRPGLHLPAVDRLLPPTRVDHECRPYELGWLLHAWRPAVPGATDSPAPHGAS